MSRSYPAVKLRDDGYITIATGPGAHGDHLVLSTPEANFIQAELRRLLTEEGVTMRDAL
jgi:hypothetical protein